MLRWLSSSISVNFKGRISTDGGDPSCSPVGVLQPTWTEDVYLADHVLYFGTLSWFHLDFILNEGFVIQHLCVKDFHPPLTTYQEMVAEALIAAR